MKRWYNLPAHWPPDGQTVWVRIKQFGPGILALWTLASGLFTPTGVPPVPWYDCARWKEDEWL
jgi:hypothetical protein